MNMKKTWVLIVFCFVALQASGQTRFGLRFSPHLSANRIVNSNEELSIKGNSVGVRYFFGPTLDYHLVDNAFFSSGAFFAMKRVGTTTLQQDLTEQRDVYNLQYIQIPLTLRLHTNEVALDTRIYFQIGVLGEVKINTKLLHGEGSIDKFRPIDASSILGMGLEFALGPTTSFYTGFSYIRGLTDMVKTPERVMFKNDLFSIDCGIKF
jgi:hypothetical protein